ncbi:hypothetical protein [Streptomyces sp. NPDC005141]
MTDRLTRADPNFLSLNLLFLLVVVFLPFPTQLVTEALGTDEGEIVAATVYGLTLLAIRVLAAAVDAYARREHLYAPREDGREAAIEVCWPDGSRAEDGYRTGRQYVPSVSQCVCEPRRSPCRSGRSRLLRAMV